MEQNNSEINEKRAQLAAKLDADLDSFMDELAAKSAKSRREKAFDFDEWCREIDNHPAFMKELKKSGEEDESGEYSAELQAIQALKYDEDDPIECAIAHKEDGNRYFKFGKYRRAIDAYTKGIRLNCPDTQLNSILYANRAAANKHLGNLRSAVRDCTSARRLLPDNFKAILRGAECLLELGRATLCLEWIEQSSNCKFDEEQQRKLAELKEKAEQRRLIEERDQRRQRAMERKTRTQAGSSTSNGSK